MPKEVSSSTLTTKRLISDWPSAKKSSKTTNKPTTLINSYLYVIFLGLWTIRQQRQKHLRKTYQLQKIKRGAYQKEKNRNASWRNRKRTKDRKALHQLEGNSCGKVIHRTQARREGVSHFWMVYFEYYEGLSNSCSITRTKRASTKDTPSNWSKNAKKSSKSITHLSSIKSKMKSNLQFAVIFTANITTYWIFSVKTTTQALKISTFSTVISSTEGLFLFSALWLWLLGNVLTRTSCIWQEVIMRPDKLIWFMDSKARLKPSSKTMEFMKLSQNFSVAYHWPMSSTKKSWFVMVAFQSKTT